MSRVLVEGFVGGMGATFAKTVGVADSWNHIVEATGPEVAKAPRYTRKIPGVEPFATIPGASSVRGLWHEDGRMFAVAGTTFCEVFADGTLGPAFTVVEDNNPAQINKGGARSDPMDPYSPIDEALLVNSGGSGIVYDLVTDTQTAISAPGLTGPYSMGLVIDTYGIIVKANSALFNFSALDDFSQFDALDASMRSEGSDHIAAMVRNHRELVMLGSQTSEVWQDDGVNPFSPIAGVFIEQGCCAPYSALSVDNAVWWLGQSKDGSGIVYRMPDGYRPERVSNVAVECALSKSADLSKAMAWSMQIESHTFYGLYVPDLPEQLVYDISTGIWTRWAQWDSTNCVWLPWFARCSCHAFGLNLIGDRSSGTIYRVGFDLFGNTVAA